MSCFSPEGQLKILVFTQGTISGEGDDPTPGAVERVSAWRRQDAGIYYLSASRKPENIEENRAFLRRFGFPDGTVLYRRERERGV